MFILQFPLQSPTDTQASHCVLLHVLKGTRGACRQQLMRWTWPMWSIRSEPSLALSRLESCQHLHHFALTPYLHLELFTLLKYIFKTQKSGWIHWACCALGNPQGCREKCRLQFPNFFVFFLAETKNHSDLPVIYNPVFQSWCVGR